MVKIIAEIGWNHMGDMVLAKEMISAAAENGADYAKFQTWSVDRLKAGSWDTDGRKEIYEKAELSQEKHIELKEFCESQRIQFMSSAFSVKDAELLKSINCDNVKIASFENTNGALLKYVNLHFKNIFISTGTSIFSEFSESMKIINQDKTTVLHCVSSYPCLPMNANLPKLTKLKKIAKHIGYSDHIQGVEVAKMALEYDIEVIEKHFTINNDLPGRDNKFAILPEELKDLKTYIHQRQEAFTDLGDDYQSIEEDARKNYRGRFDG